MVPWKFFAIGLIAALIQIYFNRDLIAMKFGLMASEPRTVFVFGGTGQQGHGCIEELLKDNARYQGNRWKIRILTRNASSDVSQQLKQKGIEVLEGDADNYENLLRVLEGTYAVFGVTFSDFENGKEFQKGKLIVDAVKQSGVELFIFSGGEQTSVPSLDVKYEIEQYARQQNLPRSAYLHTVFFYESIHMSKGLKGISMASDGTVELRTPLPGDIQIPMISGEDIGRVAARLIINPNQVADHASVPIAGDVVSCNEFASLLSKYSGLQTRYLPLSLEEFSATSFPGVAQLKEMYNWYLTKGHSRNLQQTKEIFPEIQSLEMWMKNSGVKAVKDALQS